MRAKAQLQVKAAVEATDELGLKTTAEDYKWSKVEVAPKPKSELERGVVVQSKIAVEVTA